MRVSSLKWVVTILLPLIFFSAISSGVAVASPGPHPNIPIRLSTSSNWSGYAVESSLSSPTRGWAGSLKGTWTVPALSCSSSKNTYVAIWVGIDGYSDNTVEQTGTEQQCVNGVQQNYAWVEMYPHPMQQISSIAVSVGDVFTASVTYNGGNSYTISIKDTTKGQGYSNSYRVSSHDQSVEWVVEAPYSGGILPLANYGTIKFTSAQFTIYGSTTTYAIDGRGSGTYDAITMVDPNGGVSTPSALTDSGSTSSFTTTYSS